LAASPSRGRAKHRGVGHHRRGIDIMRNALKGSVNMNVTAAACVHRARQTRCASRVSAHLLALSMKAGGDHHGAHRQRRHLLAPWLR